MTISNAWLPEGNHWGLQITRDPQEDAGPLVRAEPKMTLHTTEGTDFVAMRNVLVGKRAVPHFLLSTDGKRVVQFVSLRHASRALEHPGGTPETNRAGCIQIEICDFAANAGKFSPRLMTGLAALCCLIEHRTSIQRRTHVLFADEGHAKRIPAEQFATHRGYIGHEHVPNQPSGHWDPGDFKIHELFARMAEQDKIHA